MGYRIRDNKTKKQKHVLYKVKKNNRTEYLQKINTKWNRRKGQHKIFEGQQNYDTTGETGIGRDGNRV